jgi:hypothetical protein
MARRIHKGMLGKKSCRTFDKKENRKLLPIEFGCTAMERPEKENV